MIEKTQSTVQPDLGSLVADEADQHGLDEFPSPDFLLTKQSPFLPLDVALGCSTTNAVVPSTRMQGRLTRSVRGRLLVS